MAKYFTEEELDLDRLAEKYPEGLTSSEIVDICKSKGMKFSIATLKNYVNRGLLPQSNRLRSSRPIKGKYYTSVGRYPSGILRAIDDIKRGIEDEGKTLNELEKLVKDYLDEDADLLEGGIIQGGDAIIRRIEEFEQLEAEKGFLTDEEKEEYGKLIKISHKLDELEQLFADLRDRDRTQYFRIFSDTDYKPFEKI